MSNSGIKRSLRELLPKGEAKETQRVISYDEGRHRGPVGQGTRFKPHRIPWKIPAVIATLVILGGGAYILSLSFATATVTVSPKSHTVAVDSNMSASRGGANASSTIGFETFTFEEVVSTMVSSAGTENVETKASGKITVYNNFSEKPERLIKNTRFESADGKIFRIQEAISVPGKKTVSGEVIPGSLEVTVIADQAGEAYNIPEGDFTVPGLKGDSRFNTIYAKSKAAMNGGFVGRTRVISEADRVKVRNGAQTALAAKLAEKVKTELPPEFMSFSDGQFMSYSESIGDKSTETEAELKIKGTMLVIAFRNADLAQAIARDLVTDYDGGTLKLMNPETLEVRILSKDSVIADYSSVFSFFIRGSDTLTYTFDETELKSRLAGKDKKEYGVIFSAYPAIKRAEVSFSPSWVGSFPTDTEKIFIEQATSS